MSALLGGLCALLVLLVLLLPGEVEQLTAVTGWVRLPVEGILAALAVWRWPRRPVAIGAGVVLGLLAVLKFIGLGFSVVLDRPFDPYADWPFVWAALEFVRRSYGWAAMVGVVALAPAVVALVTVCFGRLAGLLGAHRVATMRGAVAAAVAWMLALVAGLPLASQDSYDRLAQVYAGVRDRAVFPSQLATDAFGDVPGAQMLNALRGKDVMVVFIESYGRVALPAPAVASTLEAGTERLRTKGFASRSGFLTSPTAGGGSWLAHATLFSGLWIDDQQRHQALTNSDRLTLSGAFQRAGWRTVAVMPGTNGAWPGGAVFDFDRIHTSEDLGYRGPRFTFSSIPDQYTLSSFRRLESGGGTPVMAMIPLMSSHGPWDPVPPLVAWDSLGDGSGYVSGPESNDPVRMRANYPRALAYSIEALISYVETYGDDDLVLVFLGDHQAATIVTGPRASRDVPITIVARDPAVLARANSWAWTDGLTPGPQAPVWPMDTFRDRFLAAFD
ncbi:sulfatase-like hydrolase/transferase [Allorhizocola rhizosphaerae]|uniref:sulfatase-like hydrolase/transferase n=1 Tax=Allorhizocola rhizosphaerae TaxID=1872709 RepID=UPI000E3DBDA8|nr:sulfatase-like hydrolase/transferase [Allorhizocola rhizosphaerae]